jgi:hypothetical protein
MSSVKKAEHHRSTFRFRTNIPDRTGAFPAADLADLFVSITTQLRTAGAIGRLDVRVVRIPCWNTTPVFGQLSAGRADILRP